jgi:hypothetical protein
MQQEGADAHPEKGAPCDVPARGGTLTGHVALTALGRRASLSFTPRVSLPVLEALPAAPSRGASLSVKHAAACKRHCWRRPEYPSCGPEKTAMVPPSPPLVRDLDGRDRLYFVPSKLGAARMCSSTSPPSSAPACAALMRGRSSPLTSKPTAAAASPPRPICKRSNLRYGVDGDRVVGLEPTRFYMISSCKRMGFTGTGQRHGEDLVRNAG